MAEEAERRRTKITDMDTDALVQCASLLNLQDISNLSLSCKYLKSVAYSDSLWLHLFRERWWPAQQVPSTPGVRGAYLTRLSALHKFSFADPLVAEIYTDPKFFDHLVFDQNNIIFSQGPLLHMLKIGSFLNTNDPLLTLRDHNARITSMRFFPLSETSLFRSEADRNENVLVTSSCDHSIRLWWKGCCQRSFRGHSGPVTTLSDKLIGDGNGKLFASGGDDGTVRLWSLTSSGKRGQHALKATLKGHGRSLVLMSVAGHSQSLLVSMSKDSKVRVWDTITSSSVRSSCCVGMTSVPGAPVGMKCHDSLLYVAAGSSVSAIDLRTMRKAFSTPCYQSRLYSFELLPSKSLICVGGIGSAMLWDVRRCSDTLKVNPVSELDGQIGPITHLHMDHYKIVSGGPEDCYVHVWDSDTGKRTNSLVSGSMDGPPSTPGCCAMAVKGCQIITSNLSEEFGVIQYRDFNHSTCSLSSAEYDYADEDITPGSKFWGSQSCSDSEESDS